MTAPIVKLDANIGTEGTPNWSEALASHQILFTGSGGTTGMTDPPVHPVPASTELYTEMWKGSSGSWQKINTYYNDMALNDTQNVLRYRWDAAFAAAPTLHIFDSVARTSTSQMLTGTAADTNTTSYVKMCLTNASIAANWCTATTESGVSQTTLNAGQGMQGINHYIGLDNAGWAASGSVTVAIAPWIGPNYTPDGPKSVLISLKYTWS